MGDSDLDFSLSPVKRSTAKQGRRAKDEQLDLGLEDETFEMAASPLKSRPMTGDILLEDGPRARASAPPRRTGGWGEETSRTKTAKSVYREPVQEQQQDSEEDLPMIPDLEEVEAEDLALAVADAPSVAVNRF